MSRCYRSLGIIISLLILFGLVGPLPVAHASTSADVRSLSGSLNVARVDDMVSFLPDGQLVSKEQYVPGGTPMLSLPGTITANATSAQGAIVTYIVSASDPDTPDYQLTITCTPPSGSIFPIGTTTVLCMASDPAGNSTSGSFLVIVLNRTAPMLSLPGIIIVDATSSLGTDISYTVSATDPNDPASLPSITCIPPPGSIFPIGSTTVLCTASDLAGNTTSGNFIVIVKGAAAQLIDLLALIHGFSSSAKVPALVARLRGALTAVDSGNIPAACSAFAQSIVLIEAESGKRLSAGQAHLLLVATERIQAVLACS